MLLELQQLGAVTIVLRSLFHAPLLLLKNLSLTLPPPWPSPDAAPCHSLWFCRCHQRAELSVAPPLPLPGAAGHHEASPQPPLLWAEQT